MFHPSLNTTKETNQSKSRMDDIILLILISIVSWISYIVLWRRWWSNLPPGPFPIPIIGSILQLRRNPYVALTELSKTYGPMMHIKVGFRNIIVLSTPEMAKLFLLKHDQVCSGRSAPSAYEAIGHDQSSVGLVPPGKKWRKFRTFYKEHMFSMHKLEASEGVRQEKLERFGVFLEECCAKGRAVNIGEVVFVAALNMISSTLFSMDLLSFDSDFSRGLKESLNGMLKATGSSNVVDFFPVLKWFDPQGLKRKTEGYFEKLLPIADEVIQKKVESRKTTTSDSTKKKDLLEQLLDIVQEGDSDLTYKDIKHALVDFMAGAQTTSDITQWLMTELLRNPEILSKAKDELKNVVGERKYMNESDIPKLPYLNAVIKENYRFHPPGPFLVPRKTEADVKINGYKIPKDTLVIVNAWAIGRDPKIWSNPDSFEPQRFLGNKIDYKGQDFELIPFGAGRRICPGLPLTHLNVNLILASLIHNFDWKLEGGREETEGLDIDLIYALVFYKTVPLKVIPVKN